jgi:hypothetical protein
VNKGILPVTEAGQQCAKRGQKKPFTQLSLQNQNHLHSYLYKTQLSLQNPVKANTLCSGNSVSILLLILYRLNLQLIRLQQISNLFVCHVWLVKQLSRGLIGYSRLSLDRIQLLRAYWFHTAIWLSREHLKIVGVRIKNGDGLKRAVAIIIALDHFQLAIYEITSRDNG